MVGIIVTGHGRFASGLCSALEFISGKQACCVAVDFDGDEAAYCDRFSGALETLAGCGQIAVLCDLKGGTPFKHAAKLSAQMPGLCVAYGINLPSLVEAAAAREDQDTPDAQTLVCEVFAMLDLQIGIFKMPAAPVNDEDE